MAFKSELDFGFDNFKQPKILSPKDSIVQILMNLFTLHPGNLPSQPHLGINIRQYLYRLETDIDLEGLKQKIFTQCSELMSYISIGEIQAVVVPVQEGNGILVISIPLISMGETMLLGFQTDESNQILFKYQFEQGLAFN